MKPNVWSRALLEKMIFDLSIQKLPTLLGNPKFRYCVYKSRPVGTNPSQMEAVRALTYCF
jgi:hypothetical protein